MFPSNQKLEAPEVGDLQEIWNQVDSLPEPSPVQRVLNVVRRTASGVTSSWLGSLLTVTTISVTLFIVAGVVFSLTHVERLLARTGEQMTLTLYLDDEITEDGLLEIVSQLEAIESVGSVRYRSKEEALRYFREEMQEYEAYLAGIDEQRNPLPASLEVNFREGMGAPQDFREISAKFRSTPGVEAALYNHDFVVRFHDLFNRFITVGFLGIGFLLILSAWVIYNTIRFHAVVRRDEIQVQRYMGATRQSVQLPFLLEGAVFGLVGATFAIVTLWLSVRFIHTQLIPDYLNIDWSFLSGLSMLLLLAIGMLIGTLGSWLAVRRLREL